jgi:hypothetical protein
MVGSGRTVGIILIVAGLVICAAVSLFIGSGLFTGYANNVTPIILGISLFGVIPLLILGGVGIFLFIRGGAEAKEMAEVEKKQRIVGMISAQGQVPIANVAVEMKLTRDQVKTYIYDLVNQGLFTGYIDWNQGMFYSKDAASVGSNRCPNCGGVRELVGKGIVKCPYCGVELFIPPDAPQTKAPPAPPPKT